MEGLADDDVRRFEERGVAGPFTHPLLTGASGLRERVLAAVAKALPKLAYPGNPVEKVLPERLDAGMPWFKSIHLLVPELWEIAEHPAIRDRARALLGPDVMWWGTAVTQKDPGDVHGWHFDTEYEHHDSGLLIFVGLDGVEPASALNFITHTHRARRQPADLLETDFGGMVAPGVVGVPKLSDAPRVLEAAKQLDPKAELIVPNMRTGDFVIAHAHTWHGSRNLSQQRRTAVVLSFGRPNVQARIPTSFSRNPTWYRKLPPCAMLCGSAWLDTKNPIVSRP